MIAPTASRLLLVALALLMLLVVCAPARRGSRATNIAHEPLLDERPHRQGGHDA